MHDVVRVHILDGSEGLTKELEGFGLVDCLMFVLVSKQSTILGKFHDHINGFCLDEGVPKFDDVRMVHT
jgi:hypothetical protein